MSTKEETSSSSGDLDVFHGAPPEKKLDDKAAVLESSLAEAKNQLATERSISAFIISTLVCVGVGLTGVEGGVFPFTVVACIVFNIIVSRTVGTPIVAQYLEPWNVRFQKAFDKHVLRVSEDDKYE